MMRSEKLDFLNTMSTLDNLPHQPRGRMEGKKPWSQKSEAADFIRRGLVNKTINPELKPKQLYDQYFHVLGEYGLDSIRGYWSKVRKDLGYCKPKGGRDDGGDDDEDIGCKRPAASLGYSLGEDDDELSAAGEFAKRVKKEGKSPDVRFDLEDEMTFKPLYWCESFKKNSADKLGILLNIPSGCDPTKASFTVEDSGWTLKLNVKWSKWFSEPQEFFDFFSRRQEGAGETAPNTHRMIQFEEARVRKVEASNCGSRSIVSTALIPLPIKVQKNFDFTCGAGKGDARCIYIECFADNQKATKQIAESYYS